MHVLRPGERVWLVLDDALRIKFQIEYRLAVRQDTHESLMMYRVDHWVLQRDQRWPLGFYDELAGALDACALALGMPSTAMMRSSRAKAPIWRERSGEEASNGTKASARRCGVQSCCRNSGTTFSPITRLARIMLCRLARSRISRVMISSSRVTR